MGVIEEVSRYDEQVDQARMARQRHFADRAEHAIRRLQRTGAANSSVDPEIAALALGSMVARFAELWLVERWGTFDMDTVADQVTLLWAEAIGLDESKATSSPKAKGAATKPAKKAAANRVKKTAKKAVERRPT